MNRDRKDYFKSYVKRNLDRRREYARKWREKNREKVNAYARDWRSRNVEKVRATDKAWRERNPDKLAVQRRKRKQPQTSAIQVPKDPKQKRLEMLLSRFAEYRKQRVVKKETNEELDQDID